MSVTLAAATALVATLLAFAEYPGSYNEMLKADSREHAGWYVDDIKPPLNARDRAQTLRDIESLCGTLDAVRLETVDADEAAPNVATKLRVFVPATTPPKRFNKQAIRFVDRVCEHNLDAIADVLPHI